MKRFLLEIQIGFLVTVGVALVLATGYLAYTGMHSILQSVSRESKPDVKINLIQLLATDLEKAENSVRLYAYTRSDKDLQPYYALITRVDQQLSSLRESGRDNPDFQKSVDTIGMLVEQKILIWNEMLPLYTIQQAEIYLDTISQELENKIESDSLWESRNIFQKIFNKKEKVDLDEERIVRGISDVKAADSLQQANIRSKEQKLAVANSRLTGQFYDLVKRMEQNELQERRKRATVADRMADETYQWIGWFSLSAVLSLLLVIFVITRYVRKSHKYQLALIHARNQAENLARAKELFVANVSHELRTPMNVISGFIEQLLKKPQNKETEETLRIIKSSSDHLVRIVNDILDFSKLDSGKMQLEPTHFNTREAFDELSLLFRQALAEQKTHLQIQIDESVPDTLYGDSIRLKQILINLVGNAIKFTREGEVTVQVEAKNQVASHLDLTVVVSDTGIGIAPDKLDMIFEDFTQAEAGTTQKYGGTGLGLSIVKKLMDLHDGHIEVKSTLNEGTSFICRMHYKQGNPERVVQTTAVDTVVPEALQRLKVLIVDDEAYNRKLVAAILKKWNIYFEEAENGREALSRSKSEAFDLILLDNRMPEMDGLETAQLLRKEVEPDPGRLVIVYFSAATPSEDQLKQLKKAGIQQSLPKPFTEEEFLELLMDIAGLRNEEEETTTHTLETSSAGGPNSDEVNQRDSSEIDLSQLYRVAGDDEAFVIEMLEKLVESFETGTAQLTQYLANGAIGDAGNAAHKLASPCRHIGADRLLKLLKEIETQAEQNPSVETLKTLANQALEEYHRVKIDIQKHLDEKKN